MEEVEINKGKQPKQLITIDPISEILEAYDNYDACSWSLPSKTNEQQLIEASSNGLLMEVRNLLTKDVWVNWQDEQGETALIVSSRAGHLEVVKELLNQEVHADLQNNQGWTALICASHWGYVDIVNTLLSKGKANVDIRSHRGWTALHTAAHWGHVDVLQLLLQHSADFTIQDFEGKMAKDVARENEDIEIFTILDEHQRHKSSRSQITQPQVTIEALEKEIQNLKNEITLVKKANKVRSFDLVSENHHDLQEIDRIKAENVRFRMLFESLQTKLNSFAI